jgi:hypothetical protein
MLHLPSETGCKSLDLILARLEISYVVLAVSVSSNDAAASKLQLADSEIGLRHDRAGNVIHYSVDGSLRSLGEKSTADQKV